jgi:hypothetical protein
MKGIDLSSHIHLSLIILAKEIHNYTVKRFYAMRIE